jgi:uncharacterized protein with FMN-binding domain
VGLVALLSYKSSGTVTNQKVAVSSGPGVTTVTTTVPDGPGVTATPTTAAAATAKSEGTYEGADISYQYGQIQVDMAVRHGRIVQISVPENMSPDPHSAALNGAAVPVLVQEVLKAQGLDIDAVSGATYTSDAFAQSLQAALDKEKE